MKTQLFRVIAVGTNIALLFFLPIFCFSQNTSVSFCDTYDFRQVDLNTHEKTIIEKMKRSNLYKDFYGLKINNISKLLRDNQGKLPIKLPGDNKSIVAKTVDYSFYSEDHYKWTGTFNKFGGEISILCENGKIFGNISVENRFFEFTFLEGGGNILYELNMPIVCAAQEIPLEPDPIVTEDPVGPSGLKVVSLLIVCSDYAIQSYPPPIGNLATQCMYQIEDVLRNSGISSQVAINLVGPSIIDFNETFPELGPNLNALMADPIVEQKKQEYGADLVVLLTGNGFTYENKAVFGMAEGQYAIVSVGYALPNYTFSHELGHLFGCCHENEVGPDYAHPYAFICYQDSLRTLMHTGLPPESYQKYHRIPYLSTPDVSVIRGNNECLIGTRHFNNNAGAFVAGASIYADNPTVATLVARISGPGSGTYGFNYTWSSGSTGGTTPYSYQWFYSTDGQNYDSCGSQYSITRQIPPGEQHLFLKLIVTSSDGQSDDVFYTVFLDQASPGPEIINGDELLKSKSNVVSSSGDIINTLRSDEILIYPNPLKDYFILQYNVKDASDVEVTISDLSGILVKSLPEGFRDIGQYNLQIDTKILKSGIYLCTVKTMKDCITKNNHLLKKCIYYLDLLSIQ